MAEAYNEDDSIAPEHAAAEVGDNISKVARVVDAVTPFADVGAFFRQETFLDSLGITGTAPFFAGLTALGEGLKVADDLSNGDTKKAGKHAIVGSAKAAVVFLDGATMGLAELPSLLFTGKMLSTNVGNIVGQMLDGADKNRKPTANLAAVGYPGMQMYAAPPPAEPQQISPYGMQPPPGGWQNYVLAQRGQQSAVVQGQQPAPVVSGNPRFTSAIDVARAAAATNGQQQLGSA